MKTVNFVYDNTICIACGACQVACQGINGLRSGEFMRRAGIAQDSYGNSYAFSGSCNHCEQPACVDACPTGAMYRDEERGIVLHDDGICIGCGCCVWNCPYGSVSLSILHGVSQKCDSCIERRNKGQDPACVKACPMGALRWRDPECSLNEEGWDRLTAPFLPDSEITLPTTLSRIKRGGEER